MKLDKIKFARLVGYISNCGITLGSPDIEFIDELIDINVPDPKPGQADPADVNALMALMAEGTRKIEAIKVHRRLTGYGLKESKEAVEEFWVSKSITD